MSDLRPLDAGLPKIGTPANSPLWWLEEFAKECDMGRARSFNPLERIRLRARSKAFRESVRLIQKSLALHVSPTNRTSA